MSDWGSETVFKFLDAYEAEPLLWDHKHDLHRDKPAVGEAWHRLAEMFELPVADIKKKKESLMTMFRTHFKRKRACIRAGAGDSYVPSWFAFERMERFLGPLYQSEIFSIDDAHDIRPPPLKRRRAYEFPEMIGAPISQATSTPNAEARCRTAPIPELQDANNQMKRAFASLKGILTQRQQQKEDDESDLFGRLIAKRLRKMDEEDRDLTMYEIQTLLLEKNTRAADDSPSSPPLT